MNARILKPEEWQRLGEGELSALLPYVEPENVAVVVVEDDDGEIVACVSALQVTHFEGLWIKPEVRGNPGVFRSLIRLAYAVPRFRNEKWILGGAAESDAQMDTLCRRLGGHPLPVKFFAMPVGEN
jgi:hypothetical protein